jgi:hypothetical protein
MGSHRLLCEAGARSLAALSLLCSQKPGHQQPVLHGKQVRQREEDRQGEQAEQDRSVFRLFSSLLTTPTVRKKRGARQERRQASDSTLRRCFSLCSAFFLWISSGLLSGATILQEHR